MNYHVVEARHVRSHTVWLRFRDGKESLLRAIVRDANLTVDEFIKLL